jgi:hypothetical protein
VGEKWRAGEDLATPRRKVERNTDAFRDLVVDRVDATRGRISAKRLLPIARAAGYCGSSRNFRRLVAEVKADWRRQHRVFRSWVHAPGEHLVIDWAEVGRWKIFCAALGWSRVRFVRFAFDQTTGRSACHSPSHITARVAAVTDSALADQRWPGRRLHHRCS